LAKVMVLGDKPLQMINDYGLLGLRGN